MNDRVTDFFDAPSSTPSDYQGEHREYHLNAMSLRPMQVTASLNVEGLKAYLPMVGVWLINVSLCKIVSVLYKIYIKTLLHHMTTKESTGSII